MRGSTSVSTTSPPCCTSALDNPPSSQVSNSFSHLAYTQHPCPCPLNSAHRPHSSWPCFFSQAISSHRHTLLLLIEAPCSPASFVVPTLPKHNSSTKSPHVLQRLNKSSSVLTLCIHTLLPSSRIKSFTHHTHCLQPEQPGHQEGHLPAQFRPR